MLGFEGVGLRGTSYLPTNSADADMMCLVDLLLNAGCVLGH